MGTSPDIIRCQRPDASNKVHWQDLDMFIEVKKDRKLVSGSIQQSACYARALFAYRIDRRFIRTLAVCGTTAVFLHFDRSGLIYSDDVDMYDNPRRFIRAFAGLLLLRGANAGYNPIFTNIWRPVNPQNPTAPRLAHIVTVNKRKYRVVAVLCIRKSVRGRATLVLALQKIQRPTEDKTIDAVLKLIWRDQSRFPEGTILNEFIGVYGPGRPISRAKNPFELLAGFIGALMGHWALVNKQVQHQDIGANNILLVSGDFEYKQPEWERLAEYGVDKLAQEFQVPEWDKIFNDLKIPKYQNIENLTWKFDPKRRLNFLKQVTKVLGPKPSDFLSDVDLANILTLHRGNVTDMHTHRTGTLSFMATELLLAEPEARIPHKYLHDLESFFWVLLYTVSEHREGVELNEKASNILSRLDQLELGALGDAKHSLLGQIARGKINLESLNTTWSKALTPTITEFAKWAYGIVGKDPDSARDPGSHFETVLTIFLEAAKARSESNPEETQLTHICPNTDCTSCPLLDARSEGEEPKISQSSKGSSDLP